MLCVEGVLAAAVPTVPYTNNLAAFRPASYFGNNVGANDLRVTKYSAQLALFCVYNAIPMGLQFVTSFIWHRE